MSGWGAKLGLHRACKGLLWLVARAFLAIVLSLQLSVGAGAVKPITVDASLERIDVTPSGELVDDRGDTLQVETAPQSDGSTGRMVVQAVTRGTNPNWMVFALSNPTDKPLERWLVAERYTLVGAGIIWPDLDSRRIEAVTPSIGFIPERVKSDQADIFWLTIPPGQTVTFVAELASERFARFALWKAVEYEQKARDRQLFNGIVLGITGLLAFFLTVVFAANHQIIFPSAALVTWSALALFCVDFGFWHKLFQMRAEDNAHYRAAAEAALAASLVIYLYTFLRLRHWHGFVRMLFAIWIVGQLALVAAAVLDPRLVATVARLSFAAIGAIGMLLLLFLGFRGQDRALNLVPIWILLIVWLFGGSVALTGRLTGDVIPFALVSGLALIIVLIGITTTQFAFRSRDSVSMVSPGRLQLRSQAIEGSGSAVWEWIVRRDELKFDPLIETALGYSPGELSVKVDDFLALMHPADQEKFKSMLAAVKERSTGVMRLDFRMRHMDGSYRWLELEAATTGGSDRRSLRCVGLVREVTDAKRSVERLMHDAVHDSLTGLPNRELFLDRLGVAMARVKAEPRLRPAVVFIDLDRFRSVNRAFGLIVGDSLLLTLSRRLVRHLGPLDTLARVSGDQFAALLLGEHGPRELELVGERIRHAIRAPIRIAGQEIALTASIGIAMADPSHGAHEELLREAEIAMHRSKSSGTDRIQLFQPSLRNQPDERMALEADLRRAVEQNQVTLLYQPIISLSTEELAGFEALPRWQHPKLGWLNPADFIPVADEGDLIFRLGSLVLNRAVADIMRWQKELPRPEQPLFVSVNISSRQLLHPELIPEIRNLIGRNSLSRGSLKLEISESLVMENPEQATQILDHLKSTGVELALDGFGTGYSSISFLHRFAFDIVKIDSSFVHQSSAADNGSAIVRSIVALASELNRKVVAEGVETQEDAAFLRSLGCEFAQGYYYGEPMPERDVLHLLKLIRKADRRMRRRGMVRGRDKAKPAEAPAPAEVAAAARLPEPQPPPPPPAGVPPASAPPPSVPPAAPPMQGRRPPPAPPQSPPVGYPPANPIPLAARSPAPPPMLLPPSPNPASRAPPTRPMPPTIDGRPPPNGAGGFPGGVPQTGRPPMLNGAPPPTGRSPVSAMPSQVGAPSVPPTSPTGRPPAPPPPSQQRPAISALPPAAANSQRPAPPPQPVSVERPPTGAAPTTGVLDEAAASISQLVARYNGDNTQAASRPADPAPDQSTTPPVFEPPRAPATAPSAPPVAVAPAPEPVPPQRRQMVLLPSTAASLAKLASGHVQPPLPVGRVGTRGEGADGNPIETPEAARDRKKPANG